MTSISLIGVATALLVCALLAKVLADKPKANKSQRTEIIKRLLALSEGEKRPSLTASSIRLRAPIPTQSSRLSYGPSIRSNK